MHHAFFLKNLPTREVLEKVRALYPKMDVGAVECYMTLLEVAGEILSLTEVQLSRRKTSQGRLRVLLQLQRTSENHLTPCELAERMAVTRATITGLLDGLEREDMVRRERSTEDRRSVHVCLTQRGVKFLDRLMPDRFRLVSQLMGHLSESERATFVRLLNSISEKLKEGARP